MDVLCENVISFLKPSTKLLTKGTLNIESTGKTNVKKNNTIPTKIDMFSTFRKKYFLTKTTVSNNSNIEIVAVAEPSIATEATQTTNNKIKLLLQPV